MELETPDVINFFGIFQEGHEFEGIFKYLTDKTAGNIHDNGTIEFTSNSICDSSESLKYLLDFNQKIFIRYFIHKKCY